MSELKFVTDKEGQMKRVYFERDILDAESVNSIQTDLQKTIPLTPFDPNDLHVTLLHIGKPQTLLREIQEVNPNLSREDFLDNLSWFFDATRYVLRDSPIEIMGRRFDVYGGLKDPVLVIGLEKTEEYREERRPLLEGLKETLWRCGVQTPDQFMEDNPNLRYALDQNHNPHITLGKLFSADISLPEFSPRPFKLNRPILVNAIIS